ncbi:MAG TPA: hypothetical protein VGH81_13940 [Rudaea sp.]|jgi:hypothetical protein
MNTLKLKSVTTMAAACALSLVSAATFAASRMGAPAAPSSAARISAPAKPAAAATAKTTATTKATTTRTTGQPGADCESLGNQPGHSITAPGSAFNPDGVSGTKYAGEQPQNSKNPTSVSQYDVACARSH